MTIRWLLAAIHLLALGLGFGAVWARGRALRGELDPAGLRRAFYADTWWGVAAVLWIGTGLVRAFGGFEKGSPRRCAGHSGGEPFRADQLHPGRARSADGAGRHGDGPRLRGASAMKRQVREPFYLGFNSAQGHLSARSPATSA